MTDQLETLDTPTVMYGYIPPRSFAFTSMAEALAHFIGALCSAECARFMLYIDTHPTKKDSHLVQFLSAYTLADWAVGKIEESLWLGKEKNAKEALQRWAVAMIEFNTLFRDKELADPADFVEQKGLVTSQEGHYGWEPVLEKIDEMLNFDIAGVDITYHLVTEPAPPR